MKLPVHTTEAHQGKTLELNCDQETITLTGLKGESLGTVTWGSVIDYIQASKGQTGPRHFRTRPRTSLAIKVRYSTPDGRHVEGLTGGIGGGGLFIESSEPLPIGTTIAVEFVLPDHPAERLHASGRVVWIRTRPERQLLFPGMGVEFTDISQEVSQRVVDLVTALNRVRHSD